jgi:hypothetical protein
VELHVLQSSAPEVSRYLRLQKFPYAPFARPFHVEAHQGSVSRLDPPLSFHKCVLFKDRLCGLVVRVLGYRSGGPGSIPGTTKKKNVVGLERDPLSLVSTTEKLLDRKVAAPV